MPYALGQTGLCIVHTETVNHEKGYTHEAFFPKKVTEHDRRRFWLQRLTTGINAQKRQVLSTFQFFMSLNLC